MCITKDSYTYGSTDVKYTIIAKLATPLYDIAIFVYVLIDIASYI